MAEKIATRQAYGEALAEAGAADARIVVLCADLAGATKTEMFAKKFPERFIECGIAEQNMTAVAAGLAACGRIPFASSFAMFSAGRSYEQIRNSICYPHLNVKIAATHAGLTVGEDGASHQCIEDLALMRVLPGMTVVCPADAVEARAAVFAAVEYDGPMYLRFGRAAVPVINNAESYRFRLGKGVLLRGGNDVAVIATGVGVSLALEAAAALEKEGISARVINIHTIKPLDGDIIADAACDTRGIITVEEHSIIGGLGSAVAEYTSAHCPARITRIGVNDVFGRSGKAEDLLPLFGISSDAIVDAARAFMA